ncbi:MAG TPA: glycosyltransferase family 39 protein [Thermoanaerobaculia bacterium]|nr:glycosyltransferase family 39 protein [Thermoanaerobaculia bacterium]
MTASEPASGPPGDAAPPAAIASGKRRPSPVLLALLAGSGFLFLLGLHWGLPSWHGWAGDEILPRHVGVGLGRWFSGGWHTKYPPFHYYVLALVQAPLRILSRLRWIPAGGSGIYEVYFVLDRLVSVAMALGAVLAIARVGRTVSGERAGLFAGALVACGAPFVYFAKTANVEMPFLFWFALSLVFYVRLLDEHRLRDYLWFAVCAVLAITSKDQAYGLYVLAPLAIVPSLARARSIEGARPGRLSWLAALGDRRILAVLGLGLVLAAAIYNWPANWRGFLAHVHTLLGPQSQEAKAFPPTLLGYLETVGQNVVHLRFCMGWPGFLAGVAGAGWAAARARGREGRRLASIALLGLSYELTFLAPILFSRDRYVLPLALLLALSGGRLLAALIEPGRLRTIRIALVAAVLAYGFLYALSVDLRMIQDGRYAAEEWIRARGVPPGRAVAIGRVKHAPRLPVVKWHGFERTLARRRPEVVAVNRIDLRSKSERAAFDRLLSGALGYRLAARCQGRSRWDLLDTEGSLSSLIFVDPEIDLFARTGAPAGPALGMAPGTPANDEGGPAGETSDDFDSDEGDE